MRSKQIKPGMVIHCPTEDEAEELLEYLDGLGYKWYTGKKLTSATFYEFNGRNTCYHVEKDFMITFGSVNETISKSITKFSDLIEPKFTAEEVWSIASEISNMPKDIQKEIFHDFDYSKDDFWNQYTPYEAKRRIEQWKSDHEKEEPEVEWHFHAEVHGNGFDSVKNCDTEEEAIQFIEEELKKAGKDAYGEYKRTCIVNSSLTE